MPRILICNMPKITFILFFFLMNYGFAQTLIEEGRSTVEVRKVKKNGKFEVHTSKYFISAGKDSKKVQIRIKLESTNGEKNNIDPNKFYLVLDNYKVRLRPVDLKYPFAMASVAFDRLIKEDEKNTGHTALGGYAKGTGVPDTFPNYSIEGYKDIDINLNFGTEKKPIIRTVYYRPNDIESSLIDIYFMMPKTAKNARFFYGDIKISDITVK